ncbi:CDP-diacylglycerol--glycerol-3-phosphate 3-phosphatidyltransferase 2 [Ananas comosus]|uniref:CDP-diacylglycerol--glycerol-3-phosphate 3-phosphatidyltransferase 2 n=1 Tax=Ananas comosus TaxID=4615 RepID=A0A6P5GT62_ANACO|nr:CDP-diacylglycerol--glycerol-3-phosphate 3-phosphatidyltransferase 2 [Ananas comosus]
MPPPTPASLLRAVTLLPPHRHRPTFINHGAPPSHLVSRPVSLLRPSPDASINRMLSPPPRNILFALSGNDNNRKKGAISQATRWRWMSPGSGAAERSPAMRRGRRGGKGGEAKAEAAMGSGLDSDSDSDSKSAESVVNGGGEELPPPPPRLLTVPTVLTIGRVAAVPLLVSTFYMDGRWATTATTSIFLAAAITDWLDGYIARKMRLGTAFGAFLDPVADKLMVAATLVLLCTRPFACAIFGEVPWLLTVPAIAIIGREITMSAVREWAASQNSRVLEAVAVNKLGKWKTATQMTALTILLVARDPSLQDKVVLVGSGVLLLYISAGLAVWSLVVYMKKIWKILLK